MLRIVICKNIFIFIRRYAGFQRAVFCAGVQIIVGARRFIVIGISYLNLLIRPDLISRLS